MHIDPQQYPVVFLSYDEPNADENYEYLLKFRPDALRVHGVKGSDAAHKACAESVSDTRFFTVDGDCRVDMKFWRSLHIHSPVEINDHSTLSFSGRNSVNGLCYGNGGVKLWSKQAVLEMRTHEASQSSDSSTDFCWALDYVLMPGVWSKTIINTTEYQAWRAGFREGVKFTQIDGCVCKDPDRRQNHIAEVNLHRLCIWMQLGMDARHGGWSILGARQGFYQALFTDWPTDCVQDFDFLADTYKELCSDLTPQSLRSRIMDLGRELLDMASLDITVDPPTAEISRWCKRTWPDQPRTQTKRLKS